MVMFKGGRTNVAVSPSSASSANANSPGNGVSTVRALRRMRKMTFSSSGSGTPGSPHFLVGTEQWQADIVDSSEVDTPVNAQRHHTVASFVALPVADSSSSCQSSVAEFRFITKKEGGGGVFNLSDTEQQRRVRFALRRASSSTNIQQRKIWTEFVDSKFKRNLLLGMTKLLVKEAPKKIQHKQSLMDYIITDIWKASHRKVIFSCLKDYAYELRTTGQIRTLSLINITGVWVGNEKANNLVRNTEVIRNIKSNTEITSRVYRFWKAILVCERHFPEEEWNEAELNGAVKMSKPLYKRVFSAIYSHFIPSVTHSLLNKLNELMWATDKELANVKDGQPEGDGGENAEKSNAENEEATREKKTPRTPRTEQQTTNTTNSTITPRKAIVSTPPRTGHQHRQTTPTRNMKNKSPNTVRSSVSPTTTGKSPSKSDKATTATTTVTTTPTKGITTSKTEEVKEKRESEEHIGYEVFFHVIMDIALQWCETCNTKEFVTFIEMVEIVAVGDHSQQEKKIKILEMQHKREESRKARRQQRQQQQPSTMRSATTEQKSRLDDKRATAEQSTEQFRQAVLDAISNSRYFKDAQRSAAEVYAEKAADLLRKSQQLKQERTVKRSTSQKKLKRESKDHDREDANSTTAGEEEQQVQIQNNMVSATSPTTTTTPTSTTTSRKRSLLSRRRKIQPKTPSKIGVSDSEAKETSMDSGHETELFESSTDTSFTSMMNTNNTTLLSNLLHNTPIPLVNTHCDEMAYSLEAVESVARDRSPTRRGEKGDSILNSSIFRTHKISVNSNSALLLPSSPSATLIPHHHHNSPPPRSPKLSTSSPILAANNLILDSGTTGGGSGCTPPSSSTTPKTKRTRSRSRSRSRSPQTPKFGESSMMGPHAPRNSDLLRTNTNEGGRFNLYQIMQDVNAPLIQSNNKQSDGGEVVTQSTDDLDYQRGKCAMPNCECVAYIRPNSAGLMLGNCVACSHSHVMHMNAERKVEIAAAVGAPSYTPPDDTTESASPAERLSDIRLPERMEWLGGGGGSDSEHFTYDLLQHDRSHFEGWTPYDSPATVVDDDGVPPPPPHPTPAADSFSPEPSSAGGASPTTTTLLKPQQQQGVLKRFQTSLTTHNHTSQSVSHYVSSGVLSSAQSLHLSLTAPSTNGALSPTYTSFHRPLLPTPTTTTSPITITTPTLTVQGHTQQQQQPSPSHPNGSISCGGHSVYLDVPTFLQHNVSTCNGTSPIPKKRKRRQQHHPPWKTMNKATQSYIDTIYASGLLDGSHMNNSNNQRCTKLGTSTTNGIQYTYDQQQHSPNADTTSVPHTQHSVHYRNVPSRWNMLTASCKHKKQPKFWDKRSMPTMPVMPEMGHDVIKRILMIGQTKAALEQPTTTTTDHSNTPTFSDHNRSRSPSPNPSDMGGTDGDVVYATGASSFLITQNVQQQQQLLVDNESITAAATTGTAATTHSTSSALQQPTTATRTPHPHNHPPDASGYQHRYKFDSNNNNHLNRSGNSGTTNGASRVFNETSVMSMSWNKIHNNGDDLEKSLVLQSRPLTPVPLAPPHCTLHTVVKKQVEKGETSADLSEEQQWQQSVLGQDNSNTVNIKDVDTLIGFLVALGPTALNTTIPHVHQWMSPSTPPPHTLHTTLNADTTREGCAAEGGCATRSSVVVVDTVWEHQPVNRAPTPTTGRKSAVPGGMHLVTPQPHLNESTQQAVDVHNKQQLPVESIIDYLHKLEEYHLQSKLYYEQQQGLYHQQQQNHSLLCEDRSVGKANSGHSPPTHTAQIQMHTQELGKLHSLQEWLGTQRRQLELQ